MNELSDDMKASAWSCMDDYLANKSGNAALYLQNSVGPHQSKINIIGERSFIKYHLKRFVDASEMTILAYHSFNEYSTDPEIQAGGDDGFTLELQCSEGLFYAEGFFGVNYDEDDIVWHKAEALTKLESIIEKNSLWYHGILAHIKEHGNLITA